MSSENECFPHPAYPVPTVPVSVGSRTFTPKELELIECIMTITPKAFLEGCNPGFDQKIRLLGIAQLALMDLNTMPPCTHYTLNTIPDMLKPLLCFGTQVYIMLMEQMRFSLIDLSYSDGGLSINLDRVSKIGAAYDKMLVLWTRQLENYKKCVLVSTRGAGLGTPRYQGNLSRMISMLGDGAFGWNIP